MEKFNFRFNDGWSRTSHTEEDIEGVDDAASEVTYFEEQLLANSDPAWIRERIALMAVGAKYDFATREGGHSIEITRTS